MNGNGNGTRRPEEIQAEIARTRREMDGTLSAIENRLSPGQLYDQGIAYLKDNGGTEFLQNLTRQAKSNPMPVALAGISLAWLMAASKSDGSADYGGNYGGYGTSEGAFDTAKSSISSARQKLGDTASAVRDQASQMAERAGQVRDATREQIDRAKSGLDTMMREQPLALGAIGLALGALAAALAPRTRTEDRMVGPVRDELAHKAGEQAKESAQAATGANSPSSTPDATQRARERERERLQEGVRPYAERKSSEPPV